MFGLAFDIIGVMVGDIDLQVVVGSGLPQEALDGWRLSEAMFGLETLQKRLWTVEDSKVEVHVFSEVPGQIPHLLSAKR